MLVLSVSTVGWVIATRRNDYVGHLLWQGWVPLFVAMIITCAAGMVLDMYVARYEGFAVLAMLIGGQCVRALSILYVDRLREGLPGNVGAIVVSRLSTALHTSNHAMSHLPNTSTDSLVGISSAAPPSTRLVMITLLGVTIPIEIMFLATLRAVGWLRVPAVFLVSSVVIFCVAVRMHLFCT